MADETAAKAAVEKAVEVFGRLDVVVNNAGYGDVAPFEQLSSENFHALVDTNFFGVVYMTRAAIRSCESRGVVASFRSLPSVAGWGPGNLAYHATKWAVGGFTESIAPELAPFGVKVCALEPGGMRTNWGKRANVGTPKLLPDYEASVGTVIKMLQGHWGHETSSPAKVAQVILQLASEEQLPAHLLLGGDAVHYARLAEEKREADAKTWHNVSVSTDVEDVKGLPDLKF